MGSGAMAGVVTRQYKAGSIVYFEGDKSEYIYILKSGKVVLNYIRPETGEEIKEDIRSGEFFGVKSSIGKYPREETAQTLSDTVVLQLRLDDFERIVLSNVPIVKKMLRVFSNQLRRIGRAVREVLGESNVINTEAELFKIAEYYFKNGRAEQAMYAYKKYLEYYPNTQFSQLSMQRVKDIQSGNFTVVQEDAMFSASPVSAPSSPDMSGDDMPDFGQAAPSADGPADMVDFDFDDSPRSSSTGLASEMDDFLSEGPAGAEKEKSVADIVSEAKGLFKEGNYTEALSEFISIRDGAEPLDDADHESWEESHFQIAACHYLLGNLRESLGEISAFLKKFPQSKFVKNAYLYAGYVYEKSGAKDKAAPYYKRVLATPPKDDLTAQAASRLKAIGTV